MSTRANAAPVEARGRAPRVGLTTLRLDSLAAALRGSTIMDARNVLSPDDVRTTGLSHPGVGRR
jgi:hypothetical protein